jgi:hypothetical protein
MLTVLNFKRFANPQVLWVSPGLPQGNSRDSIGEKARWMGEMGQDAGWSHLCEAGCRCNKMDVNRTRGGAQEVLLV